MRNELLVARIPNPRPAGFTHDVALVYKDDQDRVYSIQLMQHHGELKDTPENMEFFNGERKNAPDGENKGENQNQGPESPGGVQAEKSPDQ